MLKKISLTALFIQAISLCAISQIQTKVDLLKSTSEDHTRKFHENFSRALELAQQKGWETSYQKPDGNVAFLVGVDPFGAPIYKTTFSNVTAANTIGANHLWAGGSSGLNLSGSSSNMKDKLGIWDGGRVNANHQELVGRVIQMDGAVGPTSGQDHATHVTGTMMATGISANAKGMSHGLQGILAYDFSNDVGEMFGTGGSLLVSNHSYGRTAGWYWTGTRWEFYGRWGEDEDRGFGYYDAEAQLMDSIAYNAPNYLIVYAAGNNRNDNGPGIGGTYWRIDQTGQWVSQQRTEGMSSNNAYGIIPYESNAKNILTVGAIEGLANGYQNSAGVIMSSFSSWGPTDDGRIKPDVVGMGVGVFSPVSTSSTSYATMGGTSMAAPNVSGGLMLLQEYYSKLNQGAFMRAATLKGLAIHTAEEAGTAPGPDYKFGWGVVNVNKAAAVITSKNIGNHRIYENVLTNGGSFTTNITASGPLTVTLSWTDPKGSVVTTNILNNPEIKLVNDLDIRVTRNTTTYNPWILDPANPSAAATTGDNIRDNVERINVPSNVGEVYTITVTHKGQLQRGSQAYSLILSGVGGPAYCASGAANSAGSRIDSVSFGSIARQNPAGCTTYTNNAAFSTQVQPNQTLPLFVALNSCDASSANKIVKVFVDWNSNGNFNDAGELVATSNVIAGNGNFTQNITIPAGIAVGGSTTMRIVAMETSNPNDVLACGIYTAGETQDYVINFVPAANDMTITELVGPKTNSCENATDLVTVKLKNNGSLAKSNIPVTAVVKNGANVVATLTGNYPGTIAPGAFADYTFQTPFNSQPGTTYNFELYVSDPAEQVITNDTLMATAIIAPNPAAPVAGGSICGANATLKVTSPVANATYFWYNDAASTTPFAAGVSTSTTSIPANNTFYVSSGAKGTVGLSSKAAFPGGGYVNTQDVAISNHMRYSSIAPLVLESARLYIKKGGKINVIVAPVSGNTINMGAATTTPIDVYPTSGTPAGGNQPNDPNDNGAIYYLNINLPAGENVIIVQTIGDANIFRNDNVTGNPYPFSIPGIINFTGNNATNFQSFYFFFYDMKIKSKDCISPKTSLVVAPAPTPAITQVADSLVSSVDNGNQWYLNSIAILGATGKKYKPTLSGLYSVIVTDAFNCQQSSGTFNYVMSSVVNVPSTEIKLSVAPNPSRGAFTLRFNVEKKEDLMIDLVNMQGQKMSSRTFPKYQGSFNQQMNFRNLASGVYILRIQHGNKVYHEKIIIE